MKNIWITGASSGIGKALAIKFANEGWQVAASARRESLLKELSNQYTNIQSFPLDVTDSDKCKSVFKDILEKFENIENIRKTNIKTKQFSTRRFKHVIYKRVCF